MVKWAKMVTWGLEEEYASKVFIKKNKTPNEPIEFSKFARIGLNNFYEQNPKLFMSRLSKGPPPQYRWLAWKVIASRKLKKHPGLYEELLTKGERSPWMLDIMKDLDRTFPSHPFFNKEHYGNCGQKALMNILSAFSVYNEKVGYCQSMNFVVGFLLLMSGGMEKDSFWMLAALLATTPPNVSDPFEPRFEGIKGFYKKGFPLLQIYYEQFDYIFQIMLPALFEHFEQQGIPKPLWLQKWFLSLFLYSFPLGLCIRIWDNIFVHGTRYIFSVTIAILKLIEPDLLKLDLTGINEYFQSLKYDDPFQQRSGQKNGGGQESTLLPPIEDIIKESLKIKLRDEALDSIKIQHKKQNKKSEKKKRGDLKAVNKEELELKEKQQQQQQLEIENQNSAQKSKGSDGDRRRLIRVKNNMQWVNGRLQKESRRRSDRSNLEEEKIFTEDILEDYQQNKSIIQEDQQAKSSKNTNHPGGSSSGGLGEGTIQQKNQHQSSFLPQLVNYEEPSRKSMKKNVSSTRNLKTKQSKNIENESDEFNLPPIQKRNYMIFSNVNQKSEFNKSLTHKQSSENFSATHHSMQDGESDRNKQVKNKRSLQASVQAKASFPSHSQSYQELAPHGSNDHGKPSDKNNIYFQMIQQQQYNLQKKKREQEERKVKQECLEDIGDVDEEVDLLNEDGSDPREHDVERSSMDEERKSLMGKIQKIEKMRREQPYVSIDQPDEHDEAQDEVRSINQNGDQTSQLSINHGQESDNFTTDSNRINLSKLVENKQREDPGINSDRIIGFVNKLPI